ncbi:GntR family transcriptional regulator [Microvirga massiliensis]|uniref:GntR family transcriptional regulator n=1 Tax=Microvirga massiliensis TaxID=1033741 RepID=UPI00065FF209
MIFDPRSTSALRFQTAEEHVYSHLRSLILTGELSGGEKLNQDELAAKLAVSRMPIRQAIRRLESEGLVVNRPNRGAVVTVLGPDAILELFEMRSVLEGLALRLAATRITQQHLGSIEESVQALESAKLDAARWIQLHDDLHEYLCALSGRPKLAAHTAHLRGAVAPYIRLYLSTHPSAEMSGFEHHELLEVLRKGEPSQCEAAMREHIMSAAAGVVEFVRANGDQPQGSRRATDEMQYGPEDERTNEPQPGRRSARAKTSAA